MDLLRRLETRKAINIKIGEARVAIAEQEEANAAVTPDNAIGRISRMDAMYNKQVNEGTLQRARERLAKLEYVLGKIDEPGFGQCDFCHQPIQPARLVAMPESTICVRCATRSSGL